MRNLFKGLLMVVCIFVLVGCGTKEASKDISFEAQYVRTDGVVEDVEYPVVKKISSVDELDTYYAENMLNYNFSDNLGNGLSFTTAIDKYDELYFNNSFLLVVLVEENNDDIYHEISNISKDGKIIINKIVPDETGTSSIHWHLLIELDKKYSDIDYSVSFEEIEK